MKERFLIYLKELEEHSKPEEEAFSGDLVDLLFFEEFSGLPGQPQERRAGIQAD